MRRAIFLGISVDLRSAAAQIITSAVMWCAASTVTAQVVAIATPGGDLVVSGQAGAPAAPSLPPRDTPPGAAGDARIRGRIVAGDTGRPLRRAVVRISGAAIRGTRTATADVEGRYEFTELAAGSYSLSASRSGYVALGYRQTKPNTAPPPFTLVDHQVFDAGDIALPPGGVIAGRVLDEYGEPISGVFVTAQRPQMLNGLKQLMSTGGSSTNDLGEFRVAGLSPGDYVLSATVRVFSGMTEDTADRSGYAPTYYPSTADVSSAQPLSVRTGQTLANIDVALVPTRTARVSGTVLDANGAAPRGGVVMATPRIAGFTGGPPANGMIKPDGTFVIYGLTPGEYLLRASLPAPQAGSPTNMVAYVTVNGADIPNVTLQAQSPLSITGRLVGDPAALASIRLGTTRLGAFPSTPGVGAPPPPQALHDDLSFEIQALPGPLMIRLAGLQNGVAISRIRLNGRDVTMGFELTAGPGVDGVEVEIGITTGRVTATAVNSRNEPVVDRDVIVFPQDGTRWGLAMPGHSATGRTDDQGHFQSAPLLAGDYFVAGVDGLENGQANDPEFLNTLRATATRVTLYDGETANVQLKTNER
jgi:hypothetical protein